VDISQWMMSNATVVDMAVSYINMLPEIVVYPSGHATSETAMPVRSFPAYFLWFYFAVALVLLLRIVFRTMQIVWLRFHTAAVVIEGTRVQRLKTDTAPFSFFSWIFINPDRQSTDELHEILAHEMIHVRQCHSLDVLTAEFYCVFCWMNPVSWMIRKEIRKNLEFIVDNRVINEAGVDIKSYQYHLLRLAGHPSKMAPVNPFNISPLKERIMMIHVKKSPKIKLAAYVLVIPLILLFLAVNNMGAVAGKAGGSSQVVRGDENSEDTVFVVVEKAPEFPGGEDALLKYIADNIRYPPPAAAKGIQGRVSCVFVVNADGTIRNVHVGRSVDPLLDEEAVRVIQSMPKWIPGEQRGKKVAVKYSIPVRFRLTGTEIKKSSEAISTLYGRSLDKTNLSFKYGTLTVPKIRDRNLFLPWRITGSDGKITAPANGGDFNMQHYNRKNGVVTITTLRKH
jgi:TonB family protein